jgi:5-methylcytosine-specific restriction endonuclease McrA/predicted nucleic acid-binding Zn ribbon protein
MGIAPKPDPIKYCQACGKLMTRKRFGTSRTLEDMGRFLARQNCSQSCGNTKTVVTKDTLHWRARKHRATACSKCGSTNDLHVHHKDRDPANNDPTNLQTLCSSCHLKLHWQEDRAKRAAAAATYRRPPQQCVVCGRLHHPRWAKRQTCSPECKAVLLSKRTAARYAAAKHGVGTHP